MSRMLGTVSMGLRAPIIREGEDLAQIVVDCVMQAVKNGEIPESRHESYKMMYDEVKDYKEWEH